MHEDVSIETLWSAAEKYLDNNIKVFGVRMSAEGRMGEKSPLCRWKERVEAPIDKEQLFQELQTAQDPGIAIPTGIPNGMLEVIDLDDKHWPGISVIFIEKIKIIYPDLYEKLRIHATRSGGTHILYRIEEAIQDRNTKLAFAEDRSEAGIETRSNGGYIVVPPSRGYSVIKDAPIPTISLQERNCLFAIARSLNQRRPAIKKDRVPKQISKSFEESPFDAFNNSPEAEDLLLEFGYTFNSEVAGNKYFTRPGKKTGVSVSFSKTIRRFYFFTTSTEVESETWLLPSQVLGQLKFGGDYKATFKYLLERGYGRYTKAVEKAIVLSDRSEAPAILSPEAKEQFKEVRLAREKAYPQGVFWTKDEKEKTVISRHLAAGVGGDLGFRTDKEGNLYYIDGFVVRPVQHRFLYDKMKDYLLNGDVGLDLIDVYEKFIERSGKFIASRMPLLEEEKILKSKKDTAYYFYQNGYVTVTKDKILFDKYDGFEWLIMENSMLPRDFEVGEPGGIYVEYLKNLLVDFDYAKSIIGYYIHDYKDETMGYMIVLTEAVPDPDDGGGSGKNLFVKLLSPMISVHEVGGQMIKKDSTLFQSWNFQRVFAINDLPDRFDFIFFKDLSTGRGLAKKLYKDEFVVHEPDMPKWIFSTNYSYECSDGGLRRRIRGLEVTDFYTRAGGVDTHHGVMLPRDFTREDWIGYDNFMIRCAQEYLRNPKISAVPLTEQGWVKQFKVNFGAALYEFLEEKVPEYVKRTDGFVGSSELQQQYEWHCDSLKIQSRYRVSRKRMYVALAEYCDRENIIFEKDARGEVYDGIERKRVRGIRLIASKKNTPADNIYDEIEDRRFDDEPPPF